VDYDLLASIEHALEMSAYDAAYDDRDRRRAARDVLGAIAQWKEQRPSKPQVEGSNPSGLTTN